MRDAQMLSERGSSQESVSGAVIGSVNYAKGPPGLDKTPCPQCAYVLFSMHVTISITRHIG
jgi:hypothetical protein